MSILLKVYLLVLGCMAQLHITCAFYIIYNNSRKLEVDKCTLCTLTILFFVITLCQAMVFPHLLFLFTGFSAVYKTNNVGGGCIITQKKPIIYVTPCFPFLGRVDTKKKYIGVRMMTLTAS